GQGEGGGGLASLAGRGAEGGSGQDAPDLAGGYRLRESEGLAGPGQGQARRAAGGKRVAAGNGPAERGRPRGGDPLAEAGAGTLPGRPLDQLRTGPGFAPRQPAAAGGGVAILPGGQVPARRDGLPPRTRVDGQGRKGGRATPGPRVDPSEAPQPLASPGPWGYS